MNPVACAPRGQLTLERILLALAGTVILVGTVLTVTVSLWCSAIVFFVVANLWLYSVAGNCPSSLLLRKLLPMQKQAPGRHS